MKPSEKAALIALVRGSPLPRKQVLAQLGLPKSTYYDWGRRRQGRVEGLEDRLSGPRVPWNKLRPEEEQAVLALRLHDEGPGVKGPREHPRPLQLRLGNHARRHAGLQLARVHSGLHAPGQPGKDGDESLGVVLLAEARLDVDSDTAHHLVHEMTVLRH